MSLLTVVSYNIHRGRGLDLRVNPERIARVLWETAPDLVGLQEVFGGQAVQLARELGMQMAMGPTRRGARGEYGNAVLSRLPLSNPHCFDLSRPGREPRGGLRVDVDSGGAVFHLFNVHLGRDVRERREQVDLLNREIASSLALRDLRVLVGDFNEWRPGSVARRLRGEFGIPRGRARRTHPAPFPLFPLDQIYWDRSLLGGRLHVHRSRLARVASDHLPLVARLRLPA